MYGGNYYGGGYYGNNNSFRGRVKKIISKATNAVILMTKLAVSVLQNKDVQVTMKTKNTDAITQTKGDGNVTLKTKNDNIIL